MTEWNKIYNRVKVSAADNFTFVTLPLVRFPEKDAEEFIKRLVPKEKHDNDFAMARAMACPDSALRMYLCATMSSTFCIGIGSRGQQTVFYIGGRRPQDIFKLLLKLPDTEKTTTWDTGMDFMIRVAEADDFNPERHKQGAMSRGWAI